MTALLNSLYDVLSPLWEMSLTAAWVAGVVFLLRLFLKNRAPKRVLCLLWLVVFARLLLPVTPESPVSLVPPILSSNASVGADIIRPQDTEQGGGNTRAHNMRPYTHTGDTSVGRDDLTNTANVPSDTGNSPYPVVTAPAPDENTPVPAVPEASAFPWEALLAGVWLAGTAGMLGYGIVTYFRLRRRVRFAVRASGRVWEDETVSSPFILGLFRPRVYLPSDLEGRARRFILCHEFAHLRRFDHIVKPICWLALAIHWFNPAVWAAFLLLSRDMEGACDEAVLRALGEDVKADYSYTLLALASGRRIPAPCPVAFDEGDAKGRIKHVLSYRRPALWIVVMSVLAVVVAAVCLLTNPVAAEESDASPTPSESEPGPSPSDEPSPTPDESLNSVLDPWMLAVLKGERTFSVDGTDRDIDHLKEAYFGDGQPAPRVELGKLAILDLDGDGAKEMVLFPVGDDEYLYSVVGYMILRQEGDTVWGYAPGWRTFGSLKADGTFYWSSSAIEHGTGRAYLEGGEFMMELITWMVNGSFYVENQDANQEMFDAAMEAQDAKPEPDWYVFQDGVLKTDDEARRDTVVWNYSPHIPMDPAENVSVPWFLDMDQQRLYQQAYFLYRQLFGADTSAVDEWASPIYLPPAEQVEVDGIVYTPSTGLFARWDDLEAAALSVFTQKFWEERNTWLDDDGNPHSTYINVDGRTYYMWASRGGGGLNDNFPDTFHLPQQGDTEISFVLTGHYSEEHPLPGESYEERDARIADHWEEYIGFPMKLVLTENGWRFDEFHSADTDHALLPYANQAAPNPALTDDPEPEGGACVHGLDHVYVDHLTDGRLVFRCMEDFFPYYPPYPCAYSSESIWEGDCDGDGHMEQIVRNSAGTLMLCDVVPLDGQPVYGGKYGEMKTCTFDLRTLTDRYPDAGLALTQVWIEPGNLLACSVPLLDANGNSTGAVQFYLHYDGTALTAGPMIQNTP